MGLNGLDSALSGLRVAQQQLDVIASNVSNVSTEGYTRKILPQQTIALDGAAAGVRANAITRRIDVNLQKDFWTQSSSVGFLDVQAKYLNKIQQFNGPPEREASLAAKISALRESFAALSDSPENSSLQRATVNQAVSVAKTFNDFSRLISGMRNDAESEIEIAVQFINSKLQQISDLNQQIKFNKAGGKTTAATEDNRDRLFQEIAQKIGISSFVRGDGVMVIQTIEGVQLAAELPETVYFKKVPLGPDTYYPATANGLYVGGDPAVNRTAINITETDLDGELGALFDLRDNILPNHQAKLDELAHKLAQRFDQQGLQLFTNASGVIPADTAPDPSTNPPTPVEYVGFSAEIQVNSAVLRDNTLVQSGTVNTDVPVQSGSNEVIRRIVNFTFGDTEYQQAVGDVDLRASGGPTSLQQWLGLYSSNRVTGETALSNYSSLAALMAGAGNLFDPSPPGPPLNDQFTLTFSESRTAPPLGPTSITISLDSANTNFPIGGAILDAADQLVAEINAQIALAPVPAGLAAVASRNAYGQLVLQSRGNIDIDSSGAGAMGQDGLDYLGLTIGSYTMTDPYLTVQVGTEPPVTITIEPGDDETDLVAKLDKTSAADSGVAGLGVSLDALTGFLTIRPGDNVANARFGGDIKIIGGPFQTDGTGTIGGGMLAGTGIVEALFGSSEPVTNVLYSSPTATPGVNVVFRSENLGPNASINTRIISSSTLVDYGQKMIDSQSQEINDIESRQEDEASYRDLLEKTQKDNAGVNIDEELSFMIIVQTAYAAAARVVSAIDEQFKDLINAF